MLDNLTSEMVVKVKLNRLQDFQTLHAMKDINLAHEIGVSPAIICRIKKGDREPSRSLMLKLCELTGLELGELFKVERDTIKC